MIQQFARYSDVCHGFEAADESLSSGSKLPLYQKCPSRPPFLQAKCMQFLYKTSELRFFCLVSLVQSWCQLAILSYRDKPIYFFSFFFFSFGSQVLNQSNMKQHITFMDSKVGSPTAVVTFMSFVSDHV